MTLYLLKGLSVLWWNTCKPAILSSICLVLPTPLKTPSVLHRWSLCRCHSLIWILHRLSIIKKVSCKLYSSGRGLKFSVCGWGGEGRCFEAAVKGRESRWGGWITGIPSPPIFISVRTALMVSGLQNSRVSCTFSFTKGISGPSKKKIPL